MPGHSLSTKEILSRAFFGGRFVFWLQNRGKNLGDVRTKDEFCLNVFVFPVQRPSLFQHLLKVIENMIDLTNKHQYVTMKSHCADPQWSS